MTRCNRGKSATDPGTPLGFLHSGHRELRSVVGDRRRRRQEVRRAEQGGWGRNSFADNTPLVKPRIPEDRLAIRFRSRFPRIEWNRARLARVPGPMSTRILATALALVALAVTACTGGGGSTPGDASTDDPTTAPS